MLLVIERQTECTALAGVRRRCEPSGAVQRPPSGAAGVSGATGGEARRAAHPRRHVPFVPGCDGTRCGLLIARRSLRASRSAQGTTSDRRVGADRRAQTTGRRYRRAATQGGQSQQAVLPLVPAWRQRRRRVRARPGSTEPDRCGTEDAVDLRVRRQTARQLLPSEFQSNACCIRCRTGMVYRWGVATEWGLAEPDDTDNETPRAVGAVATAVLTRAAEADAERRAEQWARNANATNASLPWSARSACCTTNSSV